jgi:hypothetical protein
VLAHEGIQVCGHRQGKNVVNQLGWYTLVEDQPAGEILNPEML